MGQSEVQLILSAVDRASQVIAGVNKETDGLASTGNVAKEVLGGMGVNLAALYNPAQAAGEAIMALGQAAKDAVDFTIEYAGQVRELGRTIGASAEESSRLIQAADDVGVGYDTLSRALEGAIRKGVEPSIEGIGKLADEYLAIQDPIERTRFLMDKFGKAGADLGPLMEKGSRGIAELGEAAEDAGLVMSEDGVKAAREYEIAMDNLGDSVDGLKVQVGNGLIPVLTNVIDQITGSNFDKLSTELDTNARAAAGATGSWEDYVRALEAGTENTNYSIQATNGQIQVFQTRNGIMFDVTKQFDLMSQAEYTHAQNVNASAEEVRTLTDDEGKLEFMHRAAAGAADEQTSAEDRLKLKMDELRTLIAGPVGQENQKYYDKQIEIRDKMIEMRDKILELQNAQGTLSSDAAQKIDEMKTTYGTLQQKYNETAAAHEEATRRILYDLLQQQLSVDGLTERESIVLAGVAGKWGLIDEATALAWQQLGTYTSMVNDSSVAVGTLVNGISQIPNEKTITISADVQSLLEEIMAAWDNSVPEGHQTGADFVVPPGYPNDTFLMRAQSGERVQVTPAGETPRELAQGGGVSSQALIGEIRGLREAMLMQGRAATAWEIATSLRDVLAPVMG